jgi:hypothetical protein
MRGKRTAATILVRWITLSGALVCVTDVIGAELHPIVETESGYFFGASAGQKWIKAKQALSSVTDTTAFRVYSLTEQLGETKGSTPKADEDVCPDNFSVSLGSNVEGGVIAIAAQWNALPRKPQIIDTTEKAYIDAVRDFLKNRGIKDPKVKMKRILRIDLNGDGEDEVLLSATNYFKAEEEEVPSSSPAGSYSVVLLRRVVAGKVKTQLIAGEVHPKATHFNAPNYYDVTAVVDLNGDGKLEVVVHSSYYEGGSTTIYRCDSEKIEPLLEVGCGV